MANPYRGHCFPTEIISYCVWLYYTFSLSFCDIEKMMLYRCITVTYEAIRGWCPKFAQGYDNQIRKQRPKSGDKWYLGEVVIKIKVEQFYLRRTVDQHGMVLDILMQRRRNRAAAKKFFWKLLKPVGFAPRVIITDKLTSYGAAKKDILKGVEHRQHKGLNNRTENSHYSNANQGATNEPIQIGRSRTALSVSLLTDTRLFLSSSAQTDGFRISRNDETTN